MAPISTSCSAPANDLRVVGARLSQLFWICSLGLKYRLSGTFLVRLAGRDGAGVEEGDGQSDEQSDEEEVDEGDEGGVVAKEIVAKVVVAAVDTGDEGDTGDVEGNNGLLVMLKNGNCGPETHPSADGPKHRTSNEPSIIFLFAVCVDDLDARRGLGTNSPPEN